GLARARAPAVAATAVVAGRSGAARGAGRSGAARGPGRSGAARRARAARAAARTGARRRAAVAARVRGVDAARGSERGEREDGDDGHAPFLAGLVALGRSDVQTVAAFADAADRARVRRSTPDATRHGHLVAGARGVVGSAAPHGEERRSNDRKESKQPRLR